MPKTQTRQKGYTLGPRKGRKIPGSNKTYGFHKPQKHVPRMNIVAPTPESLMKNSRDKLAEIAVKHGMKVKTKTTKQQMVDHIMEVVK